MTLFANARVFTGRDAGDRATAFRVEHGAVTWVGEAADPGDGGIDLGGRTVLPGLLDMHTHPAVMASRAGSLDVLPPAVASIEDLVTRMRAHPLLGAGPDTWVIGTGFDDGVYPEGRPPSARDLDRVSTGQPVLVWRCDGHSASCNTRALEMAGIAAATPDPPGGRFERDESGMPTGVLIEIAAVDLVTAAIPEPGVAEYAERIAGLDEHFLSHGITGVCDLLSSWIPEPLTTFRAARDLGFRPRVALYPGWQPGMADLDDDDREGEVRVAGVKVFLDGAFSNRTAWVEDAYPDSHDHGMRSISDEDLLAAAEWARRNRVQLAAHAMGDRALDRVVALLGDLEPWLDGVPSVRLEHATLVSDELIARLTGGRMRFGVGTHTIFLYAERDAYRRNLGAAQAEIAYPIRALYDSGLPLALSSDRPATAWADADDVFVSVEAAVRRRAWDESDIGQRSAVAVDEALMLYTGRARALADLGHVGVLEPGAAGDFVVLDRDVLTVPDEELSSVRVVETWIAGERVWARGSSRG